MFLVYYGHVVEEVYHSGSLHAFEQFKLIYSFHMPLFFFISGFFWRPVDSPIVHRVKLLVLKRILPVLTFGAFLLPLWVLQVWLKAGDWRMLRHMALAYMRGGPGFNVLTWFLICLFTCEVLAALILPRLRSRSMIALFGMLSLVVGIFVCDHTWAFTHFGTWWNTWYVNAWYVPESIVALGFYALGFACFPSLAGMTDSKPWLPYASIPVVCLILLFTYRLNAPHGGFVDMAVSDHGQIVPFLISVTAGISMMLALGRLLPTSRILTFVGKDTLIYLGFDGLFFHFVNHRIVVWWQPGLDVLSVTLFCSGVTLLSMILCVPLAILLNRFIPQLVGAIDKVGPLLPALNSNRWRTSTMKATLPTSVEDHDAQF